LGTVRRVCDTIHHLGHTVVVEAVETEEQLRALRFTGADLAQGFLLARPMPIERILDWLLEQDERIRPRRDLPERR
jgi:diguanylate cyclase